MPTVTEPTPSRRLQSLPILAVVSFAAVGCGQGGSTVAGPDAPSIGPHGGPAYRLGDKGFAEVLIEPVDGKARGRGAPGLVVAAYFLQPDLKTAMARVPVDVTAKVKTPDVPNPPAVPLSIKPAPGGPGASARFASGVGPYDFDEIEGELKVTLDGEIFTRTFRLR